MTTLAHTAHIAPEVTIPVTAHYEVRTLPGGQVQLEIYADDGASPDPVVSLTVAEGEGDPDQAIGAAKGLAAAARAMTVLLGGSP